jgi:hypothetical protein
MKMRKLLCLGTVFMMAYLQLRPMSVYSSCDMASLEVESLHNVVANLQETIEKQKNELQTLKKGGVNVMDADEIKLEIHTGLRHNSKNTAITTPISSTIEFTQDRIVNLDISTQANATDSKLGQSEQEKANVADSELKDDGQSEQDNSTQANTTGPFSRADSVQPELDLTTHVNTTSSSDDLQRSDSKLAIFYNIYQRSDGDESKRKKIMDDIFTSQINLLGNSYAVQSEEIKNNTVKLFYNTIGFPLEHDFMEKTCAPFDNLQPVHMKHYEKGFEEVTLNALREYCEENPTNNVIYVHPKGSFHPRKSQTWWRKEGTMKASSEECAHHMHENKCNACGARLTYMPQHFSGNFWRAQCSYIRELRDPREIEPLFQKAYEQAIRPPMNMTFVVAVEDAPHLGTRRYSSEQWVGSHPNFWPCHDKKFDVLAARRKDWAKINGNSPEDAARRHREYFLLPGLLWKFSTVYNDTTIPPDDSWVWNVFPDGMEYREEVKSLGSLKGAVLQIANRSAPFFTPLWSKKRKF